MKMLSIPIILVCKNELGMINQTILSLECLKSHGLEVACLVVNFTIPEDEIHSSNIEYLKTQFPGCIISLPDFGPGACVNEEILEKLVLLKFKWVKNH